LHEKDVMNTMELIRCTAGYSLVDLRVNEDVLEELKVDPVEEK